MRDLTEQYARQKGLPPEVLIKLVGAAQQEHVVQLRDELAAVPDEEITLSQASADFSVPVNVLSYWYKTDRLPGSKKRDIRGQPVMVNRRDVARLSKAYVPGRGRRSDLIPV